MQQQGPGSPVPYPIPYMERTRNYYRALGYANSHEGMSKCFV